MYTHNDTHNDTHTMTQRRIILTPISALCSPQQRNTAVHRKPLHTQQNAQTRLPQPAACQCPPKTPHTAFPPLPLKRHLCKSLPSLYHFTQNPSKLRVMHSKTRKRTCGGARKSASESWVENILHRILECNSQVACGENHKFGGYPAELRCCVDRA